MREERLRATAGLRGDLNLSAWRGRSGRRYVVGIHPLDESVMLDVTEAVIIAVRRDRDGTARLIDVAAAGSPSQERTRTSWMSQVRARGATEMHVHHLAESDRERQAIVADLRAEA